MSESAPKKRIEIIDALRGFALAGIVIVHMVENYVGAPTPEAAMEATHQGITDYIVDGFIALFLRGKFFALFSFLFGLSFYLQMQGGENKGTDFRVRFLWRLIILFGIGYLHHLFYRGDILTIYAVLGVFLIPFYRIENKWILGFAAVLFLGLGRYLIFLGTGGDPLFMSSELGPKSPEIIAYFDLLKNGSITEVFISNATEGHLMKMDFQLGVFSRGYLTFGFFLMGLFIGRLGFFSNFTAHIKSIKKVLLWSGVLFFLSIGLTILAFAQLGPEVTFTNWLAMLGLTALDLNNLAMTCIIMAFFVLLYKRSGARNWLSKFAPYGRMALTNYVFQSIIGTFLFFGWGLGYLAELRNGYVFLIALGIIWLQMLVSSWWLKRFYYGPLEWLWRSLTYFKIYPLIRTT